jgi:hypothetical protein
VSGLPDGNPVTALVVIERGKWQRIGGDGRRDDQGIRDRTAGQRSGPNQEPDEKIRPDAEDPNVLALDQLDQAIQDVALLDAVLGP